MAEPLRIALVGAGGRIAGDWRRAAAGIPEVRITALVETDPHARARLAAEDAALLADPDALCGRNDVDAAIVATPPATHVALGERLLASGRDVLCEKPLAIDLAGATRLLDAAKASGRVLMMASKFRFVDDVEEARRRIAAGDIGEPVLYENTFCGILDMRGRWNSDPRISGGGVLIDNGAHAADLARVLVGEIARVFAVAGPRVQPLEVEDSARITFRTLRDCVGTSTLSWSVATGDPAYARVHGSEGSIELGWRSVRVRARGRSEWTECGHGYDKLAAFRTQLRHFERCVRGQESMRPTASDALDSVRFVAAAQLSMQQQRWVGLRDPALGEEAPA